MAEQSLPSGNGERIQPIEESLGDAASNTPQNTSGSGRAWSDEAGAETEEVLSEPTWLSGVLSATPSWLVSTAFHMAVLVILALWALPEGTADDLRKLLAIPTQKDELDELGDLAMEDIPLEVPNPEAVEFESADIPDDVELSPADDLDAAAQSIELADLAEVTAPIGGLTDTLGSFTGTGLTGRGKKSRGQLVRRGGGSAESEAAVGLALQWLAEHQGVDGGWCFDHRRAPSCGGQCRNPGSHANARMGATAMALLPFLGAGQTHREGDYKRAVNGGLTFLTSHMRNGSMHETQGTMYSHGLGAIALSEAYAMTGDRRLQGPAQAALLFIAHAQDPVTGGWRYQPRKGGDTSVVGWQLMALKSGVMAFLEVPNGTVLGASRYLDSVQANGGSHYGYVDPGEGDATTAIGLLCRMYLGWEKDNDALQRGAKWISDKGPSKSNMYYNYYATQVMHHMGGDMWKRWNAVMRDQLVNSQATAGHERGSWFFKGNDHGSSKGGRLYHTAMATMVLEVYYRHMPIYSEKSAEEDFPD